MITGLLASAGISIFNSLVSSHGEELVEKGIEKVTGIKLDGKKKLTDDEIKIIKNNQDNILRYDYENLKLILADKADSRKADVERQKHSKDWLVRNMGSIIAGTTILFAFGLDIYILVEAFEKSVSQLNPVVTLIAGASSARAIQVLSFYFGDSKVNADSRRS